MDNKKEATYSGGAVAFIIICISAVLFPFGFSAGYEYGKSVYSKHYQEMAVMCGHATWQQQPLGKVKWYLKLGCRPHTPKDLKKESSE